ncbi:ArdC-like ssDNA-binding domain-containing protein [Methylosinus sp. Sm6]|uniref:ArdC-like ssDNA-binding domain-containing protein n=1 Tax=Methylosinus sp. Sm6 TaxID=2866948 RepID=UPI001C99AB20|nr:ArdC family protein [Methylosinus sp. Sm6]MBY6240477.1 ArdC family protein [Methylosinus sp. Sm6]
MNNNMKSNGRASARCDHYQGVTDRIVAALEAGRAPWRRPWDPEKSGGPLSPINAVDVLSYPTVVSSFTCTRMRRNGFGGMAVLITKDTVVGKSTHDILDDLVLEAGLDGASRHAPAAKENCHD